MTEPIDKLNETLAASEPEPLAPRITFKEECPRCKFKHAKGKACPRCADTSDLDTGWKDAYIEQKSKKKLGQLSIIIAVLGAMFRRLEGGV